MMKIAKNIKQKAAKMKQMLLPLGNWRRIISGIASAVRRYFAWKHSWKTSSAGLVVIFVAVLMSWNMLHASAVTGTMVPDSDVTAQWSPTPSGTHYTTVDDGTADNTADYVQVLSSNTTASVTDQYTLNSPANIASASQIVVRIYMEALTASNGGTMDTISLSLIINGTAQTATTCTPTNGSWTACTATYSGSWVQTDVDSMQVKIVRNILGSGKASSQPDTVVVSNVYGTLTYVPAIQYNQSAYRWFANQDSGGLPPYPLSFARTGYSQSNAPQDISTGDFNGDGKPDMATADYNNNTVSVSLNNGDGTFATAVTYPTGSYPRSLTVSDFNGDGKPDITTVNSSAGTISVLINNGDGTFATKVDYPTAATSYWITSGDLNGDGKPDIATGVGSGSTISILINNGDGTFATNVDYSTGSGLSGVVIGDFNGDGKPDIATSDNSNSMVSILLGNGNGTFATNVDYSTGSSPYSLVASDFNGDGKLDIATANYYGSTVSILINNGNGTFATNVDYGVNSYPEDIVAADFNGDGKSDLAVANNGSNSVSVLSNNGNGTFASKIDHTVASSPYAIASADFNGDGKPDVATANNSTEDITVLMNTSLNPINVGAPLVAQDTVATAPAEGTIFRLRLDMHISGGQLDPNTGQFQLKYALRGAAASCSAVASASYNPVTDTSTGIRFADNTNAVSGMGISADTTNDPKHGTDSNITQTYQEKGTTTFTNPNTISIGQDGMWDFALVSYHAIGGDDYCFKVVKGDGTDLNTYNVYPEIAMPSASFTQASYRWYNPAPPGASMTYIKGYNDGAAGSNSQRAIVQTSDGGYATVATIASSPYAGNDDVVLSKYAADGTLSWSRSWGGSLYEDGFDLVQTSDGGYALTGYSTTFGSNWVVFLVKFDSNGNLLWNTTWGDGASDQGLSLAQTSDGGFAVTGESGRNLILVKFTSSGSVSWSSQVYNNATGEAVIQTSDGGFAIAGKTTPVSGSSDVLILKYNSTGSLTWSKTWGGTGNDIGYSLVQTADGGYVLTGQTSYNASGGTDSDLLLMKYDSSGNVLWNNSWGSGTSYNYEQGNAVVLTSDGGFAVAGSTRDANVSNTNYGLLAKYDSSGSLSWVKSWGGSGKNAYGDDLVQTSDGGYAMMGQTNIGISAGTYIAKYDSSGNIAACQPSMCTALSWVSTSPSATVTTPTATFTTPTVTVSNPAASVSSFTPSTVVIVANAAPIGNPYAPTNVPLDISSITPMNLRIAIRVDTSGINTSGQSFQLEFALRGSTQTCAAVATSSYTAVTTSSIIAYYDDSRYTSGQPISSNVTDPADGSRTNVAQSYQESNTFTNGTAAVYAGQDAMWQFSLQINNATLRGKDFCLRVGLGSDTYPSLSALFVPDVAYAPSMQQLMGGGNWFSRSDGKKQSLLL